MEPNKQENINILISDDDQGIHELLKLAVAKLSKHGVGTERRQSVLDRLNIKKAEKQFSINVAHAFQGEEAIEIVKNALNKNEEFDIIILDILMPPGINGAETLKELVKIKKNNKVIISSAYFHDLKGQIVMSAKECDSVFLLKKPYTLSTFTDLVEKILTDRTGEIDPDYVIKSC